jgi:hypothetical protein
MNTTHPQFGRTSPTKLFWLILVVVFIFPCAIHLSIDDGLRHISFAFSGGSNWADAYPFSNFSDYPEISPWFGYDMVLRGVAALLSRLPMDPLALKILLLKTLSLLFVFAALTPLVRASGIETELEDFSSILLALVCIFFFLTPVLTRAMIVRPFIFGTIFIAVSFRYKSFPTGFLSAAALIFLYPYLSWFYVLPVAAAHVLSGSRKFATGVLTAIGIFFALQPSSFWKFQIAIFSGGKIRNLLGVEISELAFAMESAFEVFTVAAAFLLYPMARRLVPSAGYGLALLCIYLVPTILYKRTFFDIFLPVSFMLYARPLLVYLKSLRPAVNESWRQFVEETKGRFAAHVRFRAKQSHESSGLNIRPVLIVLFACLIFIVGHINLKQARSAADDESRLASIPKNATVLTSFNQQYRIHFVRPDLKTIPSCDISWPSPSIFNEYRDFIKNGRFIELASLTSASHIVGAGDIHLDPAEGRYLETVVNNDTLKVWKILIPQAQATLSGTLQPTPPFRTEP